MAVRGCNWACRSIRLSITLVNWFKEMSAGSMQGLVLKTEDIEKEVTDLKAKGVKVKRLMIRHEADLLPFLIPMEMD